MVAQGDQIPEDQPLGIELPYAVKVSLGDMIRRRIYNFETSLYYSAENDIPTAKLPEEGPSDRKSCHLRHEKNMC